jgi:hypothetical protein
MAGTLQPLANNFEIVKDDGTPTDYFIRWCQQRQIDIGSSVSQEILDAAFTAKHVNAGTGLTGGGSLSSDITLNLGNTTVTPGSYTNTNLTVDAQGRITSAASGSSGGGGVETPASKPTASMFTWQNQGTASVVDQTYGMAIRCPSASPGNIRFLKYTATTLPSTWIMTTRYGSNALNVSSSYENCFIARNSSNGRIVIAGDYQYNDQLVQRWSAYNSFTSTVFGVENIDRSSRWRQMELTSTNLIFRESCNGEEWYTYYTEPLSGYLTTPDEFGIGAMVNGRDSYGVYQSFTVV